eukprot:8332527-Karenia_brevis.AAC.1
MEGGKVQCCVRAQARAQAQARPNKLGHEKANYRAHGANYRAHLYPSGPLDIVSGAMLATFSSITTYLGPPDIYSGLSCPQHSLSAKSSTEIRRLIPYPKKWKTQ